jgi:threonine 3-dehydrogenase
MTHQREQVPVPMNAIATVVIPTYQRPDLLRECLASVERARLAVGQAVIDVVVTDVNPWRLDLAKKLGATRTIDVRHERIAEVQKELGMSEGFDVGLEMSGNASAFREMLANLCHGGKVAMLGIPSEEIAIDWNTVVFNMLTISGIYGRRMYETWYKMTVMLQGGLDLRPVITHRMDYTDFEEGFAVMKSGQSGKVILKW